MSIDRQLAASRNSAGNSAGSTSRNSADNFDDYIRGVDTVNDPYYGTSQHASTEPYHWTDGYGSYPSPKKLSQYNSGRSL
jgi:hypothetical protein